MRDLGRDEFRSAGKQDFAVEIQKLHDRIKGQLHNSSQRCKSRVDQRRREMNFEVQEQRTLLERCRSCMIESKDNYIIAARDAKVE